MVNPIQDYGVVLRQLSTRWQEFLKRRKSPAHHAFFFHTVVFFIIAAKYPLLRILRLHSPRCAVPRLGTYKAVMYADQRDSRISAEQDSLIDIYPSIPCANAYYSTENHLYPVVPHQSVNLSTTGTELWCGRLLVQTT